MGLGDGDHDTHDGEHEGGDFHMMKNLTFFGCEQGDFTVAAGPSAVVSRNQPLKPCSSPWRAIHRLLGAK